MRKVVIDKLSAAALSFLVFCIWYFADFGWKQLKGSLQVICNGRFPHKK